MSQQALLYLALASAGSVVGAVVIGKTMKEYAKSRPTTRSQSAQLLASPRVASAPHKSYLRPLFKDVMREFNHPYGEPPHSAVGRPLWKGLTGTFSLLTRVSCWLTLIVLVSVGFLAMYAKFTALLREPLTLDPKADVIYEPGRTPAHRIVAEFAEVLRRNTGRTSVPESELPHSREDIRQAITTAPQWAKDFRSPEGYRLFGGLLVELENFVSSPESVTPQTIWTNQRKAIATLGGQYRVVDYDGPRPIPIGEAHNALKTMLVSRAAQFERITAFLVSIAFLGFRFLERFVEFLVDKFLKRQPRTSWSGLGLFVVIAWPTLWAVGLSLEWIATLFEDATTIPTVGSLAIGLIYAFVILSPLLVSSALFDTLVSRGIASESNHSMQSTPKNGAADAKH